MEGEKKVRKKRVQRGFYVENYKNALADYMKSKRFNQTEALKAIDISYSVHSSLIAGKRVDGASVRKLEAAKLLVNIDTEGTESIAGS